MPPLELCTDNAAMIAAAGFFTSPLARGGPPRAGLARLGEKRVSPWLEVGARGGEDRKSTRLNSSHGYISYAVFCLKKKKNMHQIVSVSNIASDSLIAPIREDPYDRVRLC